MSILFLIMFLILKLFYSFYKFLFSVFSYIYNSKKLSKVKSKTVKKESSNFLIGKTILAVLIFYVFFILQGITMVLWWSGYDLILSKISGYFGMGSVNMWVSVLLTSVNHIFGTFFMFLILLMFYIMIEKLKLVK